MECKAELDTLVFFDSLLCYFIRYSTFSIDIPLLQRAEALLHEWPIEFIFEHWAAGLGKFIVSLSAILLWERDKHSLRLAAVSVEGFFQPVGGDFSYKN